jgi:hypothetical protein
MLKPVERAWLESTCDPRWTRRLPAAPPSDDSRSRQQQQRGCEQGRRDRPRHEHHRGSFGNRQRAAQLLFGYLSQDQADDRRCKCDGAAPRCAGFGNYVKPSDRLRRGPAVSFEMHSGCRWMPTEQLRRDSALPDREVRPERLLLQRPRTSRTEAKADAESEARQRSVPLKPEVFLDLPSTRPSASPHNLRMPSPQRIGRALCTGI